MSAYSLDQDLPGPFPAALAEVKDAMKAEGFGVLSEIDIQTTLRDRIGAEIEPYVILGVCNPQLASQALQVEPRIGVFLPCAVVVRQEGDKVRVSAQDPQLIDSVVHVGALEPLSVDARSRLLRALGRLA